MILNLMNRKVSITEDKEKLTLSFGFYRPLLEEIKMMEGARWVPEKKVWTVANTQRNIFTLSYLSGKNPYEKYDAPLNIDFLSERPLMIHQRQMIAHGLQVKRGIWAAEMGTGKTLSAIEVMERSGVEHWWWAGPKPAIRSVELEFKKWKSKVRPRLMTFEALTKSIKTWANAATAPKGLIIDESSKVKTPTSQRAQAVFALANGMRKDHTDPFIILMSGTPAPKAPTDWWMQCEIACPGFLKEGDIFKLKRRLALIEQRDSVAGAAYPHLVTWKDDEDKCGVCGQYENQHELFGSHPFQAMENEVEKLYDRLKGLVLVIFKKDCLDLPDKTYRLIEITPTPEILRVAKLIQKTTPRTVQALILLRELSDGFQYIDKVVGKRVCSICHGERKCEEIDWIGPTFDDESQSDEAVIFYQSLGLEDWKITLYKQNGIVPTIDSAKFPQYFEKNIVPCYGCGGSGEMNKLERATDNVISPKIEALTELLEEYEECGRVVIYAAFTASIDRIWELLIEKGWNIMRVDGSKGKWQSHGLGDISETEMLEQFQSGEGKMAFLGHPGSGSHGLTLTASPVIIYYSNDHNGENRSQSEDRIHRAGMDVNRGATIIDLIHLPSDKLVLENLQKKRKLEKMTMGELEKCLQ